jgi:hypothetical protein
VVSPKGDSIFAFCLSRLTATYNPSKEKLRDRQTSKVKPHGYQLQSLVYLESDLSEAVNITIFRTYLGVTSSEGIYQNSKRTRGGPFEYTCDNRPTQQREKTQNTARTRFQFQDSVSWNCLFPIQKCLILGTTFIVSIPKPSDAGTTIIRTLTPTR